MFDYVLVIILAILSGGWALPAGITFGLHPLGVFLAATIGALAWTAGALLLGGRWRDRIFSTLAPDAERRLADSRARDILDRWGLAGLAIVGMVVLGPTVTVIAALVFDLDRRRFLSWSAATTVALYAVSTVVWAAVL